LVVAFVRIPIIAIVAYGTFALLAERDAPMVFPPVPTLSAFYMLSVNLVCLFVLRWRMHREGRRVRDLIGFDSKRLGRDIASGLLWLAVLYVPFALTIVGVMFVMFGGDALAHFETVFIPTDAIMAQWSVSTSIVVGALTVLFFAPINAPTEELVFRGYAQDGLLRASGRPWLAIVIPSVAFGLEHVFFAPTLPAQLVYAIAFFVWGMGSGLIVHWQRRLMPIIVSHFIVNLLTSLPALLMPLLAARAT
jgi:membrane protease YdiL (CAAX protease family)